jgi:hypothetical protein
MRHQLSLKPSHLRPRFYESSTVLIILCLLVLPFFFLFLVLLVELE